MGRPPEPGGPEEVGRPELPRKAGEPPPGPRVLLAGGGTGGHLYPALNLADALRRAEPRTRLLLVGARRGIEARVLPETGLPHRLLPLQPLHRSRPWRNWRLAASLPAVAAGLAATFRRFDPDLVMGTGGYASGPAVAWGAATGRRTAIQEQNAWPGLVTRMLARVVDQVHLGYPEAEGRLRVGAETRVFAYGNPVAAAETESAAQPPGFDWPDGRVVLVTGGSQGARGLNLRLLGDLERAAADPERAGWPEGVALVWVAGPAHAEEVGGRAARLPWADRIRVVPFIEGLGSQLARASLAVCRAGAMFVSELAAAGVPAVFVPFPAAAGGHQSANARAVAEAGAAVVREEAELEPGELWATVLDLLGDGPRLARMAEASAARGAPEAAGRIARELLSLVAYDPWDPGAGERRG